MYIHFLRLGSIIRFFYNVARCLELDIKSELRNRRQKKGQLSVEMELALVNTNCQQSNNLEN